MRARNVKPAVFKNELLATSDPLHLWIFEGLWCMADREGRLEDRPRRIHLEINPGRAYEGTEAALTWLAKQGFIVRYTHGSGQYIQIVNFTKHQNPHVREPASSIPPPGVSTEPAPDNSTHSEQSKSGADISAAPGQHQSGPALSSFPLPDTPSLIPERGTHDARARAKAAADEAEHHVMFQRLQDAYPPYAGRNTWLQAEHYCRVRIDEGSTWLELEAAVKRYAAYVKGGGVSDTGKVLGPLTFFSAPDKPWTNAWTPPTKIERPTAKVKFVPPPDDPDLRAGHA